MHTTLTISRRSTARRGSLRTRGRRRPKLWSPVRRSRRALAVLLLGIVAGCGGSSGSDAEAELRALVAEAEAAAEDRDTGFFRELISTNYADAAGRSRDDLIDRVRGYFFLNTSIEVLTRIERVELSGSDAAELVVQAAIVGGRRGGALPDIDADYRRLEVELVRDGSRWQVIAAAWGRE